MNERASNPGGATSGQGGQKQEKSKFRMESQQERTAKAKLQMEKRWDKLETARNRLANQKPPKKRGPLRRMGGPPGGVSKLKLLCYNKEYEKANDSGMEEMPEMWKA